MAISVSSSKDGLVCVCACVCVCVGLSLCLCVCVCLQGARRVVKTLRGEETGCFLKIGS